MSLTVLFLVFDVRDFGRCRCLRMYGGKFAGVLVSVSALLLSGVSDGAWDGKFLLSRVP